VGPRCHREKQHWSEEIGWPLCRGREGNKGRPARLGSIYADGQKTGCGEKGKERVKRAGLLREIELTLRF
jgi:hypothetical protein